MRHQPTLIATTVLAGLLLACGGLGTTEQTVDPDDPAQKMLDRRDYTGAENALKQRLRVNRDDIDARILLGDVNFLRGQDYKQQWRENLGWARDHWVRAVRRDPTRCDAWRRLSTAVVALSVREDLATPAETFDLLPLARGWKHCPGAAMLGIVGARPVTPEATEAAWEQVGRGASDWELQATLRADLKAGLERLDLSRLKWTEGEPRVSPSPGLPFVVLEVPLTAQGVGRSKPRPFTYPERIRIREAGQRITYDDRRFPGRVAAEGLTLATACPGTTWTLEGPDRYPVGRCTSRPFDTRRGEVYDPARVVPVGPSHWQHSTFPKARIDRQDIAEDSVRCVPGPVGRLYVETATCKVTYDKAIPQRRSIPASAGIAALDDDHAQKILDARGLATLWGDEVASHLARGEIALGMPHHLWTWALSDPGGCTGRGLYQRTSLDGAHVAVTCPAGGRDWTFTDLELTGVSRQ